MSQQQAELGQERLRSTLEALERIRKAGAKSDDVELLAKELGVSQWMRDNERGLKNTTRS